MYEYMLDNDELLYEYYSTDKLKFHSKNVKFKGWNGKDMK